MAETISKELELSTWDGKVYNKSRVLRAPYSKHQKTGLYKVPVAWQASLGDIQERAKDGTPAELVDWTPLDRNPVLSDIYARAKVPVIREMGEHISEAYTGVLAKPVVAGDRNDAAYRMARYFARRDVSETDCKVIMEGWNRERVAPPLSAHELEKTILSAYAKGVNHLQDDADIKVHVHNIDSAIEQSRQALAQVGGGIKTGYVDIDTFTMGFQPQDLIVWGARTRTFKTALASALCQRISYAQKKPALFFSMEMPVHSLNYRHMQYGEGMSRKTLYESLRRGDDFPKTRELFKHVDLVGLSNLTTNRLVRLLDHYLETYRDLSFVAIDYLSLFQGCASDAKATARQITELKTVVCKMLPCPLLVLAQAKREFEGDEADCELTLDGIKDSSYVEDSADWLFGAWNYRHVLPDASVQRVVYARALKARAYDSESYSTDTPYFTLDINAEHMNVENIIYDPNPPKFKRRSQQNDH
jgi:hypothetical protein